MLFSPFIVSVLIYGALALTGLGLLSLLVLLWRDTRNKSIW